MRCRWMPWRLLYVYVCRCRLQSTFGTRYACVHTCFSSLSGALLWGPGSGDWGSGSLSLLHFLKYFFIFLRNKRNEREIIWILTFDCGANYYCEMLPHIFHDSLVSFPKWCSNGHGLFSCNEVVRSTDSRQDLFSLCCTSSTVCRRWKTISSWSTSVKEGKCISLRVLIHLGPYGSCIQLHIYWIDTSSSQSLLTIVSSIVVFSLISLDFSFGKVYKVRTRLFCLSCRPHAKQYVYLSSLHPANLTKTIFITMTQARRKNTGFTVAMKFISKHGKSEKDVRNLRQEIGILRKLNHENIILMFDAFETDREFCVVTEYAQGELFDILQDDQRLPESTVQQIAKQLVKALHYLHSNRIIHR